MFVGRQRCHRRGSTCAEENYWPTADFTNGIDDVRNNQRRRMSVGVAKLAEL
jgi:hypothetical protein